MVLQHMSELEVSPLLELCLMLVRQLLVWISVGMDKELHRDV